MPQDPLGPTCGFVNFPGWMSGRKITMAHIALQLTQLTRRRVVDETGLTGDFDMDVTFMPDQPVRLNGGAAPPELAQSDRPPLLTAIQDDLGLKLDARRRDVDVLVIDRVERPSENQMPRLTPAPERRIRKVSTAATRKSESARKKGVVMEVPPGS